MNHLDHDYPYISVSIRSEYKRINHELHTVEKLGKVGLSKIMLRFSINIYFFFVLSMIKIIP